MKRMTCAYAFVTLFCWCQVNSPTLHCEVHEVHYFTLGFNFADELKVKSKTPCYTVQHQAFRRCTDEIV